MQIYDKAEIGRLAKQFAFPRDTFEKVLRLKEVLIYLNEDSFLREHLLLKGGTAINLTVFNIPRLSVDIDMDFVPNMPRMDMIDKREQITEVIKRHMTEEGYQLSTASRFSHSLDAFYFQYRNAGGNPDVIKLEINYSLRSHLFQPVFKEILTSVFDSGTSVRMLHPMEIFAAKGNALLTRAAARDLYDWCNMIDQDLFKDEKDLFRKSIIFYMTISSDTVNKAFDTSAIDKINFSKIRRELFPVLSHKEKFDVEARKESAKAYFKDLMEMTDKELEYIERFAAKEYVPELLFEDDDILVNIMNHPMALWKCRKA